MGTRLAHDRTGLGPFTVLEKADVAGLFLAYGQLAMKCPVSRQLKQALALLLLVVTWLALLLALLKYPFYSLFILDNGMNSISKSLTVLTPA